MSGVEAAAHCACTEPKSHSLIPLARSHGKLMSFSVFEEKIIRNKIAPIKPPMMDSKSMDMALDLSLNIHSEGTGKEAIPSCPSPRSRLNL